MSNFAAGAVLRRMKLGHVLRRHNSSWYLVPRKGEFMRKSRGMWRIECSDVQAMIELGYIDRTGKML